MNPQNFNRLMADIAVRAIDNLLAVLSKDADTHDAELLIASLEEAQYFAHGAANFCTCLTKTCAYCTENRLLARLMYTEYTTALAEFASDPSACAKAASRELVAVIQYFAAFV